MKKLIRLLFVTLLMMCLSTKMFSQYNELWSPIETTNGCNYFIGSANMDNDPQSEIVVISSATLDGEKSSIFIIDSKTGNVEWESAVWDQIDLPLGITWNSPSNNSPVVGPKLIDGNGDGRYDLLFFGLQKQGDTAKWHCYSYSNSSVIVNANSNVLKVEQNYPNPFNESTTIRFKVEVSGFVTIKIFDVKGNELETLINEQLSPDEYEYDYNGSKLKSGVYFYQIQIGEKLSAKKMLKI